MTHQPSPRLRASLLSKAAAALVAGLALLLFAPLPASADTVVSTIAAPGAVGGSGFSEHGSVFSPDGSTLYVTTGTGIAVIDTTTNTVLRTIATAATPDGVAVSPDGKTLYATLFAADSLAIIDLGPDTVTSVSVGDGPAGVTVSLDGTRVYVKNVNGTGLAGLSVVDTVSRTVVATVTTPTSGGRSVVVSPDGSRLYLPGYSPASPNITVLDTSTYAVIGTIVMGAGNRIDGMAFNTAGTRLYAAVPGADAIATIDAATNTVTGTIPVGDTPAAVALTSDGTRAYASNFASNTVSIVDLATGAQSTTVAVGAGPRSIRIAPDGLHAYVTNVSAQTVSVIAIDTFPTITTVTLPAGETDSAYAATITGTGTPAPTFSVTAGTLPPGLVLDAVTGAITGTPTAAGSFSFTVTASSTVSGIPSTAAQAYTVTIAPAPVAPTAPTAPLGLTATIATTGAQLNWTAPNADGGAPITGYRIERAVTGGAFATIVANTSSTATTYTDTTVVPGTTYDYRVHALNTAGESAPSNFASVTLPQTPPTQTPPTSEPGSGVTPVTQTLASTGNESAGLILPAVLLILIGAAVALGARVRRSA